MMNIKRRMVRFLFFDKHDRLTDVVIGFDNINDYQTSTDRY